ncbi:hypothetical protein ACP70R_028625 [Stipagrostis hirtigluma subsp. patula]
MPNSGELVAEIAHTAPVVRIFNQWKTVPAFHRFPYFNIGR